MKKIIAQHLLGLRKSKLQRRREYYPFGLQMDRSWTRTGSDNDFLYNAGSELNSSTGWYETFFRGYDAALGRFAQVDPVAIASSSQSPYNFGFNNPVLFNDPNGDYPEEVKRDMREHGAIGLAQIPDPFSVEIGNPYRIGPGSGNHWSDAYRGTEDNAWLMSSTTFNQFYGTQSNEAKWDFAQKIGTSTSDPNAIAASVEDGFRDRNGRFGIYQMNVSKVADQNGSDGWSIATEMVFTAQQGGPYSGIDISFNGLRQYLAIVAGESGNNIDEASAIGSVILNRLAHKGANMQGDFVSKIGGKGQYDAIGGKIYNEVMAFTNSDLLHIINNPLSLQGKYADRIMGAMGPIVNNIDYSQRAYFWNASSPQTGFNWNQYNNGTFVITTSYGGSTFFRYADGKGRIWP